MTNKQNITNTLRFHRKKAGLRQLDVARILGLASTDRISHWEKGRMFPHLLNLFKLASLYGVPPHALYDELFEKVENDIRHPSALDTSRQFREEIFAPESIADELPGNIAESLESNTSN